jgi:hypothetical protein
VPGAADLEKDQALVLELDFLVVDPARQQHGAIDAEHLVAATFPRTLHGCGGGGAAPGCFGGVFMGAAIRLRT